MNLPPVILTCVILSSVLLLMFLYFKNAMKSFEGFPFTHLIPKLVYDQLTGKIPKDVPFTGYVLRTLIDVCERYHKDGLFMTYTFRPTLFIFGDEAMKFFLNEKAAINKPPEYSALADLIGVGLATSNGERWKTHKKLIDPVFSLGSLKDKVSLFNEHALVLVKDIEKLCGKPSADLLNALKFNYFNALSESIFGLKQDAENRADLMRLTNAVDSQTRMIVKRFMRPWLRPKFLLPFSNFGRKFLKLNEETKSFVTKVIIDMKKTVTSNTTVKNSMPMIMDTTSCNFGTHLKKSFTYILLKQQFDDPSFNFQDLHDEVTTILGAGYDTITYATLWCLFMIGHHPEVQEKAFCEVQETTDGYITYEDTCNFKYLEAVIKETLRLYPVIPIFGRNLTENVQFGKYKVHKDTTIGFVPYFSQRNPEIYPNPEKFEPERFLRKELRSSETFVPFGAGTRTCIGKKYAMIEMKIFLAYMLRNFRFVSLDKIEDIHPCWNVILTPSRHIHMKIISRDAE